MTNTNPTVAELHDEFCNREWNAACRLCTRTQTATQESLEAEGWKLTQQGEFCSDCATHDIVRYCLGWDAFLERNMAANVEDAKQWKTEREAVQKQTTTLPPDTSPIVCPF